MHKLIDDRFEELVADLKYMLSFRTDASLYEPTENDPFGRPMTDALNAFLKRAESYGFTTRNLDNYVGYVDISTDKSLPLYGIMCHLDVVPAGDESLWHYPPFGGVESGGRLYGRGSFDDKGPAVASLHAMRAIRDTQSLKCRFRLIVGLDEETGAFRCIKRYKKTEEIPLHSFSPDGAFPLINAEKGILRLTVRKEFDGSGDSFVGIETIRGGVRTNIVPGKAFATLKGIRFPDDRDGFEFQGDSVVANGLSTHVKHPWDGKNAILLLLQFLAQQDIHSPLGDYVRELHRLFRMEYDGRSLGIACHDDVSGDLTCTLAVIDADRQGCTLKVDIRYPVTFDGNEIVEKLKRIFGQLGASVTLDSRNAPLYVPEDDPFVQLLLGAYTAVTGQAGKPISTGGGTYCRDMPRSVSFGILFPGEESVAHSVDEYVSLASLKKAAHIYGEAFERINGKK